MLKGVITSGTGTAANYGCPAAGKTGTAENYENAWFVGYTPRMATAVWVGYPQGNIPMANGFGGTLAAPIWHDYMRAASGGYCGNFPLPTTPFTGTAYFGPHSSTGNPSALPKSGHSGSGSGSSTRHRHQPVQQPHPVRPAAPTRTGRRDGQGGTSHGNNPGAGSGASGLSGGNGAGKQKH